MESSILISTKKLLGIAGEYNYFDTNLIMHINSVFAILTQMGVGSDVGFSIEDNTAVWTDFIPKDPRLGFVKSYMYLKVRLIFDPPLSTAVLDSMNKEIEELEWRILVASEK